MLLEVLILSLVVVIIALFIDHYNIHQRWYDVSDFRNAFWYLAKSHEGIIVFTLILIFGILIGGSLD